MHDKNSLFAVMKMYDFDLYLLISNSAIARKGPVPVSNSSDLDIPEIEFKPVQVKTISNDITIILSPCHHYRTIFLKVT